MGHGIHWEWRGFGGVKSHFIHRFCELPIHIEPYEVEDLYLWVPNLMINSKFRSGAEDGLKFKRLRDKDGSLEKWIESPDEIFDFPLGEKAWNKLSAAMAEAGLSLPSYPDEKLDRPTTRKYLTDAGCNTIAVQKHRESRRWEGPHGTVLIEWCCLSQPQRLISIGMENSIDFHAEDFTDEMAKSDLRAAIAALDLDNQPLSEMNYVEAIKSWINGQKI